jgi:hypothetical protein
VRTTEAQKRKARDHVDFEGCFTANFAVFQRQNLNQFVSAFFKSICNLVPNFRAQFAIVLPVRRLESLDGGPSGSFDIGATCVGIATNPLARCRIEAVGVLAGVNPLTVNPILCGPILAILIRRYSRGECLCHSGYFLKP